MTTASYPVGRGRHATSARADARHGFGSAGLGSYAASSILLAAVLYNCLFAFLNAHVRPLSPGFIIATEALVVAGALLTVAVNYHRMMRPWAVLLGIVTALFLFRGLTMEALEAKYFRDLLIIPVFVMLGMTLDLDRLTRLVVVLHAVVLGFTLLEAVNPDFYAATFDIKSYYINTRDYDPEQFWNTESNLFASATRPDDRFFGFLELHRLSSVFLEPVSFGNYCIIVISFICARFPHLNWATFIFLSGATVIMIVGSDSRFAGIASFLIIVVTAMARHLPRGLPVLYPPAVLATMFAVVSMLGLRGGSDDFSGRVAHTVELLQKLDLAEFFGASTRFLNVAVDSGVSYLIITQSLVGILLVWSSIVLSSHERTGMQIRFLHALALYISFAMLVSFSFLSIKTAALLWLMHGSIQASLRNSTELGVPSK